MHKNVEQGIDASFWGLIAVIVFMLIYYKIFGIIASFALVINIVLLVGLMSIPPGATLTMPGIAGIVLTLGMSVDANVLYFLSVSKKKFVMVVQSSKPLTKVITVHSTSIFDANLTTILTAIILYAVGTGPIQGFAVTLALGVVISMFTAITGTRAIVNFLYGGKRLEKLSI